MGKDTPKDEGSGKGTWTKTTAENLPHDDSKPPADPPREPYKD